MKTHFLQRKAGKRDTGSRSGLTHNRPALVPAARTQTNRRLQFEILSVLAGKSCVRWGQAVTDQ